uniref:heat shock protein beta-11-like n=1 Tax=Myxine glutinosa TaxID=7769 RepID=UPI00358E74EA
MSLTPLSMLVPIRYTGAIPSERGFGGALDELQDELRRSERIMELLFQQAQSRIRGGVALNLLQSPGHGREVAMAGTCLSMNQSDVSRYMISLDTRQFDPEKMSVKVVGDLLQVSGRHEVRNEDGQGGSSYSFQEFREEMKLPRDVDPQKVTCCFMSDGRLRIEAPRDVSTASLERIVPIERAQEASKPVEGAPGAGI